MVIQQLAGFRVTIKQRRRSTALISSDSGTNFLLSATLRHWRDVTSRIRRAERFSCYATVTQRGCCASSRFSLATRASQYFREAIICHIDSIPGITPDTSTCWEMTGYEVETKSQSCRR